MKLHPQERPGAYPDIPTYPTEQKFETPDGPVIIKDNYTWLTHFDTDREAEAVIAAQNDYTDRYLEHVGTVEAIYNRLEQLTNSDTKYGVPSLYQQSIVWAQREPDQQQWVMMRIRDDASEAEVVINPNELGEGISVAALEYSPDEQYLVYELQQSGDEISRAHIRNETTGETEHFYTGKIFHHVWDKDSSGFTYVKSEHEAYEESDPSRYQKAYHHSFDGGDDKLVFDPMTHDLPPSTWVEVLQSNDTHTVIGAWLSKQDIRQYIIDNATGEATELLAGTPAAHRARIMDGYVYLTTTLEADNMQVVRVPITRAHEPIEQWESFLPERPDQQLQRLAFSRDYAIVEYTHNTASQVELRDRHSGELVRHLDMPELSNIASLSASTDREEFFYSVSNCLTYETAYCFNNGESKQMWQDSRSMDPEKVQATQEWCQLPDGSCQPMFVIAAKGTLRDQPRPVWLEGYGGFANGRYPKDCYNDLRRIWIEQGGIAIEPCLPGGDEFGRKWHEKAIGANRPVAFDGMIRAIEHAIDTGMTTPDLVALSGGSNGGLMATVVGMQRPDIVRVVNSRVPLQDMYNYTNYLIGNLWAPEFGDPHKPEEFPWLSYSPYHSFDPETQYPSFFFTANARDTRVHPVHAFKMAALMQSGNSTNPIILRTDADSGHASSKGISHRLLLQAERLAFMMHELGMEFKEIS